MGVPDSSNCTRLGLPVSQVLALGSSGSGVCWDLHPVSTLRAELLIKDNSNEMFI